MLIESGNMNELETLNPDRAGWCVGSFIEKQSIRYTQNCEVKWTHHPKGLKKSSGLDLSRDSRTLVTVISGSVRIDFENGKSVTLSKPGDYLVFGPEEHETEILEDCLEMIVRWYPSSHETT